MRKAGNTFAPGSSLFSPSIIRGLTGDASALVNVTAASLSGSSQDQTGSFRFDPPGTPIKSTQQIPVDWSKFENHTFFNSAEAKVNTAFDLIINNYPFDGTRDELLAYLDGLTGFERYVLDRFPKSVGHVHFSGSADSNGGTHLVVKDLEGTAIPSLARSASGKKVLDQGTGPITFEFHLSVPENLSQGNQVIIQRLQGTDYGITLALSATLNVEPSGSLVMLVSSGTSAYLSASMPISKGEFQHVCATYDARPTYNRISLFRNARLESQSSQLEMGDLGYGSSLLTIASGTDHLVGPFGDIAPGITFAETLSGSIDELRVYHSVPSADFQKKYMRRSVYPSDSLRLYYKFNEPTGSYPGNTSVIDSSGRALHASLANFTMSARVDSTALANELPKETPVLFPSYPDVVSLNEDLLSSASQYDVNNPNLVTKLIPRHYLQEASIFEGFGQNNELGDIDEPYGTRQNFPGGGSLGSAQIIASLLFVWAKQFDELKMHLDQFGRQNRVDPLEPGTVASTFLPFLAESYGITLPEMFPNASYDQFYEGINLTTSPALSESGLQYVQNQIWRRVLSDLVEIFRSKGTVHSIKSLIRDMGINPDSNFRFREFGGSRTGRLSDQRVKKSKLLRVLDFSGSYGAPALPLDVQGVPADLPYFKSPSLVDDSPRTEPGYPEPSGTPANDHVLTSGSWTYEATYRMVPPRGRVNPVYSSLVRFATSGTINLPLQDSTFLNLLAYSGSIDTATTSSLALVFRDTWSQTDAPTFVLPLTGVDIFDGERWHVSFGRQRNDAIDSVVSSSWFLRAGKQQDGRLVEYKTTSTYFDDSVPVGYTDTSVLTTPATAGSPTDFLNASGAVIHVGSQSVPSSPSLYGLSYSTSVSDEYRESFFGGKLQNLRFWSKALTDVETREHVANPLSVGVDDAKTNFNFNTTVSGTWERVRLDLDLVQETSDSDAFGNIVLVDMSQNSRDCTVTGLEPSANVLKPDPVTYSTINPNFDQSSDSNKVRIRSWSRQESVDLYGGVLGPLHEIPEDEVPIDDTRFSIEMNAVQALNEDIIRIFSSLDAFDGYIGRPELQFSEDYPDLAALRDVYFKRLEDKVNFKTFFEFFKWFDGTISHLIEMLIPRKTKFLGVNFVIEPHMLERPKIRYNTFDLYLGPNDRNRDLSQLLVQQLVAELKRY